MKYIEELQAALTAVSFSNNDTYEQNIGALVELFLSVRAEKGCAFFIGNGGSAGIAMHMTADFFKNGQMRTHGMYDPATLTCLANDFGYEHCFSRQIEWLANAGDVLVAISSSGESANILNAAKTARDKNCRIVTLTGFKPTNTLRRMGDVNIHVPCAEYGIVESIHNLILQQVVDEIFSGTPYPQSP